MTVKSCRIYRYTKCDNIINNFNDISARSYYGCHLLTIAKIIINLGRSITLVLLEKYDAGSIEERIKSLLLKRQLGLRNLVGIRTDNASAMAVITSNVNE